MGELEIPKIESAEQNSAKVRLESCGLDGWRERRILQYEQVLTSRYLDADNNHRNVLNPLSVRLPEQQQNKNHMCFVPTA